MGGVIIAIVSFFRCCCGPDLANNRVLLVLASMFVFATLGYFDDRSKMMSKSAEGGASRIFKSIPQIGFGILLGCVLIFPELGIFQGRGTEGDAFFIPFLKSPLFHLSWGALLWGIMVWRCYQRCELYGWAGWFLTVPFFGFLVLGIFSFVHGNIFLAEYLYFPYFAGAGELAVVCSVYMGCCLGFCGLIVFLPRFLWETLAL